MLYMPATTTATPVVLQETQQTPLQSSSHYYMLQSTPIIPAVPILNTTYVYPRYGFVPKPVETSVTKDEIEKTQLPPPIEVPQPVQHIVHHYVQPCTTKTCPGYCELCCPWIDHSTHQHHRPRSCSPKPRECQHRESRRDQFERDEFDQTDPLKRETIDEKIERIRRELRDSSGPSYDKSMQTIDNYQSPAVVERHIIHHRPRSTSRPRSASGTREPWRPSNQNDYPWRDAHLPAYREATLARTQTPANESRTWKETAHERSHKNTQHKTSHCGKNYVYRPRSETEVRKWYTDSTGKDPDREVYQALRGGTTTYQYKEPSTSYYNKYQSKTYDQPCYSNVSTTGSKVHTLKKLDSTQHHNLYSCNEPCLHVIPKQGSALDPPYMKILNAPVTYLH